MNTHTIKSYGLLGLVLLLSTFIQAASNIYDQKRDFIKLESGFKNEWFKFIKNHHDLKFDLLAKEYSDKANLLIGFLNEKQKNKNINEQSLDLLMKNALNKMIQFTEDKMEEWKKLCDNEKAKGDEIYANQKAKLESFKQQLGGRLPLAKRVADVATDVTTESFAETATNAVE